MPFPKKKTEETVDILPVSTDTISTWLLGTTPIILNRMSEKAKRELLIPRGRKTEAEKATTLKHDPLAEFRASPYTDKTDAGPTYLLHLASAIKRAMMNAAVDLPGAKKAQVGRLCWVKGERVALYGIPKIFLSVVRNAGIVRTPDIRSRAIVPAWAMFVTVEYVVPVLRHQALANLIAAAGIMQGTGDWRTEKGAGNYGSWRLADPNDPELMKVIKSGGRAAQLKAMEHPLPYDDETEELLRDFDVEVSARLTRKERVRAGGNGEARV